MALAGALALYLALAFLQIYPAWTDLDHGVVGDWMHPDMVSNHWLYRWLSETLLSGGSILHNDRYYHPVGDAPWLAGNGSDAIPFSLLAAVLPWPGSVTVWVLAMITMNGLGGWALCRAVGASPAAALVGGSFLVLCPYVTFELGCARLAQAPLYWFAFFGAAWVRLLKRPTIVRGVVAGLLYGATAFTYWYYGLWAAWLGGILLLFRPRWQALVGFVPTALLTVLPPLWLFSRHWAGIPGTDDPTFPHVLAIASGLPVTFPVFAGDGPLKTIALPLILVVLALLGLRASGRRFAGFAVAAVLFAALALGPHLLLPSGEDTGLPGPFLAVYGLLPPLRRFWWPYRHIAPLTLALVPLAALGAQSLIAGLGRWTPAAALGLVALTSMELSARAGNLTVTASWWEPPPVYEDVAALPAGALLELPLWGDITRSQQSLSYQWVHRRTLVNGHAMWVERVRPDEWDDWLSRSRLLSGLLAVEQGAGPSTWSLTAADVDALRAEDLRYISLNREFFPGELASLHEHHVASLQALFGAPLIDDGGVRIWYLAQLTGATEIALPGWTPPEEYRTEASGLAPVRAPISSLGWRPLPRSGTPATTAETAEERQQARERAYSPMLRRRLERRRADEADPQ